MNCPVRPAPPCGDRVTVLRLAALRLKDEIDPSGEVLLRSHLDSCPGCFAAAVAVDPAILFVRLAASAEAAERASRTARGHREEPAEAELLAADVLAALRLRATEDERRPARFRRLPRTWLRAAAVVLLATGLAAVLVLRRPAEPAPERREEPLAAAPGAPSSPLIEELASPGARVYEFAGSTPQEPTVVFVANPGADI